MTKLFCAKYVISGIEKHIRKSGNWKLKLKSDKYYNNLLAKDQ